MRGKQTLISPAPLRLVDAASVLKPPRHPHPRPVRPRRSRIMSDKSDSEASDDVTMMSGSPTPPTPEQVRTKTVRVCYGS